MTRVRLVIADYIDDPDPAIATAARGAKLAVALLADTIQNRATVDDLDDDPDGPEPDDDEPIDIDATPRKQDGRTASWGSTKQLAAWCAANGIEWSGRGRPPKALIDAYLASTSRFDDSTGDPS